MNFLKLRKRLDAATTFIRSIIELHKSFDVKFKAEWSGEKFKLTYCKKSRDNCDILETRGVSSSITVADFFEPFDLTLNSTSNGVIIYFRAV